MNPSNRVVILTGATQGIGRATARTLAQAGCFLALAARTRDSLDTLAAELNTGSTQAIAIPTDMGDTVQAANLVRATIATFGRLDIVINNAALGVRDEVVDLDESQARRVMDVNYFGPVALIQAAIPYLKANRDGGLIINISSIVGRRAMPGIAGYCASKAALEKMAESLRIELKRDKIRVSTVYPGVTATRFNDHSLGDSPAGRGRLAGVPAKRVARAILRTIHHERRDVFITLFDRTFITVGVLWPWLMDQMLGRYTNRL
ncbi:MAG: SDR family NAD(P)-dependent oxidoreductase [Anaerolineaceae bacterium]|nr:SDR family NAD(P)-dependent oxidoreductase [Anaerolineaceae bacterium]MCB9100011.1 SDR family NAD(P)-dependent oxidoreductase [Anaerolineales bacterium]